MASPDSPDSQGDVTGNSDLHSARRSKDKVFLIGFSATGKSHSGRLAAQALGARFEDMDRIIVRRTGMQIAEIFARDGEEEFRRMERHVLREVAGLPGRRVISTGGGVPVDSRNREVMASSGFTIRLMASPETIHGRLQGRGRRSSRRSGRRAAVRPMLSRPENHENGENEESGIERVRTLLADREEAYASAADAAIDTEGREPPDVASEIVSLIRGRDQKSEGNG